MDRAIVEMDLHGKNVYQARIAINAALRRVSGGVCRLRLIHGCHGGSALRDMILAEYPLHPRVKRLASMGDGITDLILREFSAL